MKRAMVAIWLLLLPGVRAEWVELFNGKDFAGWGGAGLVEHLGYQVKDGMLQSTPEGRVLATEKDYADYILEFEFQLTPGANNGLGIHYPGKGDPAYSGMELQILDNTAEKFADLKPYQFHGSLYSLQAAERGHLKPVGEWNAQRVTVRGDRVSVELNGVCILDVDLVNAAGKKPDHAGVKRRAGKICFCGHGDVVRWRGVRIAELGFGERAKEDYYLPAGKSDKSLEAHGFSSLFDGVSLAGWKGKDPGHAGHWLPKEGWILSYDGKSTAKEKNLWSEEEFGDFALICDWRWVGEVQNRKARPVILPNGLEKKNGAGQTETVEVEERDSGIYLRGSNRSQVNMWAWPIGSGEVYGVRTKHQDDLPICAAVTPRTDADRPIGEWNRFVIEMRGDRLTVFLNGDAVLHEAVLPGVAAKGPLALQHHGSALDFANLYVKKL